RRARRRRGCRGVRAPRVGDATGREFAGGAVPSRDARRIGATRRGNSRRRMMTALVVGTVLAIAGLAFVMAPVVMGVRRRPTIPYSLPTSTSDLSIAALREIEFDRATGKLSDDD